MMNQYVNSYNIRNKRCVRASMVFFQSLELCGLFGFRYKSAMGFDGSKKQVQVLFSGRVQGVGFRYTVCRIAESFEATGFVRNLAGGDVEVVAEGSEQELVDFLNAIRDSHLGRQIIRERLRWVAVTGAYDTFGVSY